MSEVEPADESPELAAIGASIYKELSRFMRHPDAKPLVEPRAGEYAEVGRTLSLEADDGIKVHLNLYDERSGYVNVASFVFTSPATGLQMYSLADGAKALRLVASSVGQEPRLVEALSAPECQDALDRLRLLAEQEERRGNL